MLWDTPFDDKYSSPVLKDNRVYYTGILTQHETAHACCRDAITGELIWQTDIGDPGFSSPILADEKLMILTDRGRLLHIIDSATGRRLGLFQVNGAQWLSPAIANGRLYIELPNDGLACYDLTATQGRTLSELPRLLTAHSSIYRKFDQYTDYYDAHNDRIEPTSSTDRSTLHCDWWDHKGTSEWVQYDFTAPREVSEVGVYWYVDKNCAAPQSWQLLYQEQGKWQPVETDENYGVAQDRLNWIRFKPVTTTALRLQAQLQPNYSAGILQWKLRPSLSPPTTTNEPKEAYFTSAQAESMSSGWGEIRDNCSFSGGRLAIGTTVFTQGIGMHAPSSLTYRLGNGWQWLSFYAGISADKQQCGTAIVQVWLDGKLVFSTPLLRGGAAPVYLCIPVAGARVLQLVCTGSEVTYAMAHVNLCNLRLSSSKTAPNTDGPSSLYIPLYHTSSVAVDLPREQMRGEWHIEGDELVQDGHKDNRRLNFGDPNWNDYEFTMEAMKTEGQEGFFVFFRVTGEKDFYIANFGRWGKQLTFERERSVDGWQLVGPNVPGSIEPNRWYKLRVRCEGRHFQAWLDDHPVIDFTDDEKTHMSGGVGLGNWSTNARFRNIKVTALDGRVLFQGLP